MTNCLVVDDEPLARQVVEAYIRQTADLRLVTSCAHAFEAFEALTAHRVDLLFLDIQLPSLSGIDLIRRLKQPPALIFTTAYAEYAVASYELEAVDYLLKPITYERFTQSINKFFKRTTSEPAPALYSYFKVNGQLVKLQHSDILYAQSIKDYILLKTLERSFIVHLTMKSLSELLPESRFRRIHRSYLVNLSHITKASRQDVQLGAITLPIGESYRGLLNDFLN